MIKKAFAEQLNEHVVIGDGAMGTMLYEHGVFVNTCFDELNLTRPEMVQQIHRQYIQAGSDFIETNTFGSNEYKLARFGLVEDVERINERAVELALECAGEDVYVAGSMGPLGREVKSRSRTSMREAREAFSRQAKALHRAGVDFFILETFANVRELEAAIEGVCEISDRPIVAQLTTTEAAETIYGESLAESIAKISVFDQVIAVGLNCSVGPAGTLESLKLIRHATHKPISIQPNAGLPQEVDGRSIYMCTPEYMAEYAKRFFENGARIIGGCCGTTPRHIEEIAKNIRSLDKAMAERPAAAKIQITEPEQVQGKEPVPLGERSKLGAKLAAGEPISCIEVTPPKGVNLSTLIERVEYCAQMGIDAVNIPDGPRASSRMSPLVTAAKIQEQVDIETILHVCCRDRNLIGMQSDMMGAYVMGVNNVLLVTGDPPKVGDYPEATAVFDLDSIALTAVVRKLNLGIDIGNKEIDPPLAMTIGVGANPVASDMEREIERFRQKVEAGAEYAITQPVFDTQMLFAFQEAVKDFSIPILAGIWPFTSYKNAEFMANEVPGVVVPEPLLDRMSRATTREEGRRLGVEIAREMIEEIGDRVAGFAVSAPFGNVKMALAVHGKIGVEEI